MLRSLSAKLLGPFLTARGEPEEEDAQEKPQPQKQSLGIEQTRAEIEERFGPLLSLPVSERRVLTYRVFGTHLSKGESGEGSWTLGGRPPSTLAPAGRRAAVSDKWASGPQPGVG